MVIAAKIRIYLRYVLILRDSSALGIIGKVRQFIGAFILLTWDVLGPLCLERL